MSNLSLIIGGRAAISLYHCLEKPEVLLMIVG